MSEIKKLPPKVVRPPITDGTSNTIGVNATQGVQHGEKTVKTEEKKATPGPVAALFTDVQKESTQKKPGTLKPHEALMTTVNKPKHSSFAAAFSAVLGKGALDELRAAIKGNDKPIVLIAGDQCTGKGTAAEGLVVDLGGANTGTGTVLRALSKENKLEIEEMSAMLSGKTVELKNGSKVSLADYPHLGTADDVDVKLDFRAAKAIASSTLTKADGKQIDVSVFESRLAGHLGQFLEGMGRQNIVSVYLYAAPKVQAERYLEREVWSKALKDGAPPATVDAARAQAQQILGGLADDVTLGGALQKLIDGLKGSGVNGLEELASKVAGIAGRDSNDQTRLLSLYGVNYQDRSAFDVVVDTNGKTPAQVKQAILDAVAAKTKTTAASSAKE